ncbi:MAG: flagellar motor switch protein FliG, partial [Plesiomonas shigelloides]
MTETEVMQPEDGLQQAAILLLSMGEEAAANILKQLSREEVSRLTVAMASLPGVKKDQAQSVFLRFFT